MGRYRAAARRRRTSGSRCRRSRPRRCGASTRVRAARGACAARPHAGGLAGRVGEAVGAGRRTEGGVRPALSRLPACRGCCPPARPPAAEPLPLLRDVPPHEKQALFVRKLHLCAFSFDFTGAPPACPPALVVWVPLRACSRHAHACVPRRCHIHAAAAALCACTLPRPRRCCRAAPRQHRPPHRPPRPTCGMRHTESRPYAAHRLRNTAAPGQEPSVDLRVRPRRAPARLAQTRRPTCGKRR